MRVRELALPCSTKLEEDNELWSVHLQESELGLDRWSRLALFFVISFKETSMARRTSALDFYPNLSSACFQTFPNQDPKLRLRYLVALSSSQIVDYAISPDVKL